MRSQLRSEMVKLGSTRTTIGLLGAMLGLVVIAVFLHGYGLPSDELQNASGQLDVLIGWGAVFGALFAGLLGAMAITGETVHGTIRPTLLVTPRRGRVIAAKGLASSLVGFGFGLTATGAAAAAGRVVLAARGLESALDGGDYVQFVVGGAVAAALWAAVGLGVGTLVRSQVPTIVGILAWVLFVEGLLLANAPSVGRFAPGALGQTISGLRPDTLLASGSGAVALAIYAATAMAVGTVAAIRRDIA